MTFDTHDRTLMFCFSGYTENTGSTKKSYELELLQMIRDEGKSIFACDQGSGPWEAKINYETKCKPSSPTGKVLKQSEEEGIEVANPVQKVVIMLPKMRAKVAEKGEKK